MLLTPLFPNNYHITILISLLIL